MKQELSRKDLGREGLGRIILSREVLETIDVSAELISAFDSWCRFVLGRKLRMPSIL